MKARVLDFILFYYFPYTHMLGQASDIFKGIKDKSTRKKYKATEKCENFGLKKRRQKKKKRKMYTAEPKLV